MDTTPTSITGVHFVAKVVKFGERKEVFICCPKDSSKTYKMLVNSGTYRELNQKNSPDGMFLLIERKGHLLNQLWKLKDYANSLSWKPGSYEPKLEESLRVELKPTNIVMA